LPLAAPQDRPEPGADLARRKGFAHVVVRAQLQPEDAVDLLAARREKDDGQLAGLADGAADVETVAIGHTHVEDGEVGRLGAEGGQCVAH
jgi:hypothetical protein